MMKWEGFKMRQGALCVDSGVAVRCDEDETFSQQVDCQVGRLPPGSQSAQMPRVRRPEAAAELRTIVLAFSYLLVTSSVQGGRKRRRSEAWRSSLILRPKDSSDESNF